jgi:hypothetical protein
MIVENGGSLHEKNTLKHNSGIYGNWGQAPKTFLGAPTGNDAPSRAVWSFTGMGVGNWRASVQVLPT